MPAADYSKRQRGDGRGRAIQGGPATSTLGEIPPNEGDIMGRKGKYAAKAKA